MRELKGKLKENNAETNALPYFYIYIYLILNLLDRELANTDRSYGVLRRMPRCCCSLRSGSLFGKLNHPEPESNVWLHKTGTLQIIDKKWGLSFHSSQSCGNNRWEAVSKRKRALGAAGIRRGSDAPLGKVSIGAYAMDTLKLLPAWICSVGWRYRSVNVSVCAFSRGYSLPPAP